LPLTRVMDASEFCGARMLYVHVEVDLYTHVEVRREGDVRLRNMNSATVL
jgi:hypothetical protein